MCAPSNIAVDPWLDFGEGDGDGVRLRGVQGINIGALIVRIGFWGVIYSFGCSPLY